MRRKRARWFLAVPIGLFVAVNVLAWFHAGAMIRWSPVQDSTARPEDLGLMAKLEVLLTGVSIPRPVHRATPLEAGLDFEPVTFPNGQGDELEAWYLPGAEGDTLTLLFHGYCSEKSSMLPVARGITDLGSRVLMVDFFGSGGSSGTGTSVGLRESLDVLAAFEWARDRWPECRLVGYGQSMGGAAILRAIANHGVAPDAVVLESTFDRFLSTVSSRFHRLGLPATPLAHLLVFWGSVRLGENAFAHNPSSYAAAVTCPCLVLQGAEDPNVSGAQASSIRDALRGWSRLEVLPKVAHSGLFSSEPERWAEAMIDLFGHAGGHRGV